MNIIISIYLQAKLRINNEGPAAHNRKMILITIPYYIYLIQFLHKINLNIYKMYYTFTA